MTGRAYVLIFFFWAVLTVVTPTLILLSENSEPGLDSTGEKTEGIRTRKMMGSAERQRLPARSLIALTQKLNPPATPANPEPAPVPAPVPVTAPAPSPVAEPPLNSSGLVGNVALPRLSQRQ